MSIRAFKFLAAVLAVVILLLAWRWFSLYRQMVTAAFISAQCELTEEHLAEESDAALLAHDLGFLTAYYEANSKTLAGSPIYRVVQRDYEHALTNSLARFRRVTTNDLGGDPRAWIQRYGK
jgi:hypothetical protein